MMEAASPARSPFAHAGTLRLSKLIAFYDDNNGTSIDGHVEGWFTDDTPKRFEAYGWNVRAVDAHAPPPLTPPSAPRARRPCVP